MKSKRKKSSKKSNSKKAPFRIVRDLPLGKGKGIIITKKNKRLTVKGKVVQIEEEKVLHVSKGERSSPIQKFSFGSGTRVKSWKPETRISVEKV